MEVQDHFTVVISDGVVWVGRRIIEEPDGCVTGCLCCFELMGRDCADGNEHGRFDNDGVLE